MKSTRLYASFLLTSALLLLGSFLLANSCFSDPLDVGGFALYSPFANSRSNTAENPSGLPGMGAKSRAGRKGAPCIWKLMPGESRTLADVRASGVITHIWFTFEEYSNTQINDKLQLQIFWDENTFPSVNSSFSQFFGLPFGQIQQFETSLFTTGEGRSLNSFVPMPFGTGAKVVVTNSGTKEVRLFFYQIDYLLDKRFANEPMRLHTQSRFSQKTALKEDFIILESKKAKGRYLGTFIGLVDRLYESKSWWGEGELKIFLDGDRDFPTIVGTGTEDYVLSGFGLKPFTNTDSGMLFSEANRHFFYRFHNRDPIYFHKDIKVTLQQLGNLPSISEEEKDVRFGKYFRDGDASHNSDYFIIERSDTLLSTSFWYQTPAIKSTPQEFDLTVR